MEISIGERRANRMYENLTNDELRVFRILEGLGDTESLTGSQIMERLMIKDRRFSTS